MSCSFPMRDTGSSRTNASSSGELARGLAHSRRDFLRSAAHLMLGSAVLSSGSFALASRVPKRKVVVITFGGGARDEETFAPDGQQNIPHLLLELSLHSTLLTPVVYLVIHAH